MDQLFFERLAVLSGDRKDSVVASFSLDKQPTFRVNTLVVSIEKALDRLAALEFSVEKQNYPENAFVLMNRSKREFTDLPEYIDGWFYLQSLSSMVPVALISREVTDKLDVNRGMIQVLDMCAAPGSKTSQLAAVMENKGHIDAYDMSRQRIFQMKAVLASLKVTNVDIHQGDASGIWRKFGPVFDVVMLDAVCGGEGRFKFSQNDESEKIEKEDDRFAWSLKNIERMSAIQKRLVFSAIMCLKPGGVLVYSTCTFAPEENEAIINFAIDKFEGAVEIEKIDIPNIPESFVPGVNSWNGTSFDSRVSRGVRILPDALWDGFYVTVVRRN